MPYDQANQTKRSAFVPQCAQNPKQNEVPIYVGGGALSPYTSLYRPAGVAGTALSALPPCPPHCLTRRDLLWLCVFCPADSLFSMCIKDAGDRRVATSRRSSLSGSQAVVGTNQDCVNGSWQPWLPPRLRWSDHPRCPGAWQDGSLLQRLGARSPPRQS